MLIAEIGIGELDGGGICRKNDVTELDAAGRDDVAETVIVLAEEFGEVVKEDKQEGERPAI